jgi:hypothetical protein
MVEVFVPSGRSVQPGVGKPQVDSPIAHFPNFNLLACGIAACALGIARRAVDELVDLAQGKTPLFSSRTLAKSSMAQVDLARAEAAVCSARAFLFDEVTAAWERVLGGDRIDLAARARVRLACTHAAAESARPSISCTPRGGTSVFSATAAALPARRPHRRTTHGVTALRPSAGRAGCRERHHRCERPPNEATGGAPPVERGLGYWQDKPPMSRRHCARADRLGAGCGLARWRHSTPALAHIRRAPLDLTVGPLAVHVRTPAGMAMGAASVRTGRTVVSPSAPPATWSCRLARPRRVAPASAGRARKRCALGRQRGQRIPPAARAPGHATIAAFDAAVKWRRYADRMVLNMVTVDAVRHFA